MPKKKTEREYYKIGPGQPRAYQPDELLEKANEYFEWCIENPFYESQVIRGPFKKKDSKNRETTVSHDFAQVPRMRPMTIEGFCNYAGIVVKTFHNYEKYGQDGEHDEAYLQVTRRIRQIIENQQLEGAAAGFFQQNIIARKLGLADKRESSVQLETPAFNIDPISTD